MAEQPAIERAFFREAEDGTTVFFPWGLTRRGFRLGDARDRKRAARATSLLIGTVLAVGTWTAYALQPLLESESAGLRETLVALAAPGAALGLACLAYWLWAWRFTERLMESDLRVSRDERLREAARLVPPWQVTLIGVVTCALSGLVFWIEPRGWWLGALGVATGLALVAWSVVLRRAAAGDSP